MKSAAIELTHATATTATAAATPIHAFFIVLSPSVCRTTLAPGKDTLTSDVSVTAKAS